MREIRRLMNKIILSSLLFSVTVRTVVEAEEYTPVLSDPVTPPADSSAKLEEILSDEPLVKEDVQAAPSEPIISEDIETTEANGLDNETTLFEEETVKPEQPEVESQAELEKPIAPVESEENSQTELEKPTIPSESEKVEDSNPGFSSSEENITNDTRIEESEFTTDEEIIQGFERIEMDEPVLPKVNTEEKQTNDQSFVEPTIEKPDSKITDQSSGNLTIEKAESKVIKSKLDRLPETGIVDNIEIIYIFEIIILGLALILLSFKPRQKVRMKKQ